MGYRGDIDMKIKAIKNGVVVDHIVAGRSMKMLKSLGQKNKTVILLLNVPSRSMKKKDILKIENRNLNTNEIKRVFKISPRATVNRIKNSRVIKKITK